MVKSVVYLDMNDNGRGTGILEPYIRTIELQDVTKIPEHIGNNLDYFFNQIEKRKVNVDFVEKDKFYFTPNCSVPRGKFKTYCESNNMKVIRDPHKANYVVFSKKSIDNMLSHNWNYTVTNELLINILDNSKLFIDSDVALIKQKIDDAEYKDKILISYSTRCLLEKCILMLQNIGFLSHGEDHKKNLSNSQRIINVDDRKTFELVFDPNIKLINQELILSKINSDNVINKEMYESIEKLLQSNQESDWTVAMEIMANSDLDKSALYNFLLLREYYGSRMAYAKSRNHVNFKSMIEYYGINKYSKITLDLIIDFLKSKNVFTQYNYDVMNDLYRDEIISYLGDWRFKNIDFKAFNFNIVAEIDIESDELNNEIEEECLNQEA